MVRTAAASAAKRRADSLRGPPERPPWWAHAAAVATDRASVISARGLEDLDIRQVYPAPPRRRYKGRAMEPSTQSAVPLWGRRPAAYGPLVVAHRGASALVTENTTAAFARAARDGADGVELDVLCCATGEVVVFHDDDLTRLAGRSDRIDRLPFVAVREVILAGGVGIPTLEEAFEACGPALLVNVELKTSGLRDRAVPALVERVSAILDRTGTAERVVVSSFSPVAVWLWR